MNEHRRPAKNNDLPDGATTFPDWNMTPDEMNEEANRALVLQTPERAEKKDQRVNYPPKVVSVQIVKGYL